MKIRVPPPSDLHALPALSSLLVLDVAAAIAANALRAQHLEIDGDFHPGETDEITTARVLARECDMLRDTLNEFRRRALARLARERDEWPF
jgi:hypothetical protein